MNDREIFMAALDRKSPDERNCYLDEACGNDRELRLCVDASHCWRHHRDLHRHLVQRGVVDTDAELPPGAVVLGEGRGKWQKGQASRWQVKALFSTAWLYSVTSSRTSLMIILLVWFRAEVAFSTNPTSVLFSLRASTLHENERRKEDGAGYQRFLDRGGVSAGSAG